MRRRFKGKSRKAFLRCLHLVPYKTGKLRNQGVKYKEVGNDSIIYVDLEITPYGEYINRPGYKTRGWFQKLCKAYARELENIKGGKP